MTSIEDRRREIEAWLPAFGHRRRATISADEIRAQLHAWRKAGKKHVDEHGAETWGPLSASSCNHRRTALLHLYRVLDGRGAFNPVRDVPPFKEPPPAPSGLPLATVRKILGELRDTPTRALLQVLAYTAMRRSELVRMQPGDVDLERGCCWVKTGKGGEPRLVMLNADGIRVWQDFMRHNAWREFQKDSLRHALQRAAEKHGMMNIRAYDLRHSFATALRQAGADLADVQAHLGHSTPRMTKRYAPTVREKLRAAVQKLA